MRFIINVDGALSDSYYSTFFYRQRSAGGISVYSADTLASCVCAGRDIRQFIDRRQLSASDCETVVLINRVFTPGCLAHVCDIALRYQAYTALSCGAMIEPCGIILAVMDGAVVNMKSSALREQNESLVRNDLLMSGGMFDEFFSESALPSSQCSDDDAAAILTSLLTALEKQDNVPMCAFYADAAREALTIHAVKGGEKQGFSADFSPRGRFLAGCGIVYGRCAGIKLLEFGLSHDEGELMRRRLAAAVFLADPQEELTFAAWEEHYGKATAKKLAHMMREYTLRLSSGLPQPNPPLMFTYSRLEETDFANVECPGVQDWKDHINPLKSDRISMDTWKACMEALLNDVDAAETNLNEAAEKCAEVFRRLPQTQQTDSFGSDPITQIPKRRTAINSQRDKVCKELDELLPSAAVARDPYNRALLLRAAIDEENDNVNHLAKLSAAIKFSAFIITALIALIFGVGVPYAVAQYTSFSEPSRLFGAIGYLLDIFVLFMCCYGAARRFIRDQLKAIARKITKYAEEYFELYQERFSNFKKRLACKLQLTNIDWHTEGLIDYDRRCRANAAQVLWHTARIREISSSLVHFDTFISSNTSDTADPADSTSVPALEPVLDDVHNKFYHPNTGRLNGEDGGRYDNIT